MSKHKVTNEIRARIADKTVLPVDVLGKEAVFQLFSDREMILEGVRRLEYYDECYARIRTGCMFIEITGAKLVIKCLANQNISVSGQIEHIDLERLA